MLLAAPATATDWIEGKWCDRDKKTIEVDKDKIIFNGRNQCAWMVAPDKPPFISPLYCKNISTERGATIEKFQQTFVLAAEPFANDQLRVTVGQNNTEYKRCD